MSTLVFDNVIDKLPESIGNLSKLIFLNLTNNKNLTTLPESMVKLTCLQFVSVKDCGINVDNLSPKILKYFNPIGDFWEVNFPPEMMGNC
jgi:Leucine-rich repeat (LRR) protein